MTPTVTEGPEPGCIGRIAELHARHDAAASGFGLDFEARVARELADFCLAYRAGRDGLRLLSAPRAGPCPARPPWGSRKLGAARRFLEKDGGRIEGSVAIDGSHAHGDGAHLRWFIVSDALRGHAHGRALLCAALAFADRCGRCRVVVWTFAGLDAAGATPAPPTRWWNGPPASASTPTRCARSSSPAPTPTRCAPPWPRGRPRASAPCRRSSSTAATCCKARTRPKVFVQALRQLAG